LSENSVDGSGSFPVPVAECLGLLVSVRGAHRAWTPKTVTAQEPLRPGARYPELIAARAYTADHVASLPIAGRLQRH